MSKCEQHEPEQSVVIIHGSNTDLLVVYHLVGEQHSRIEHLDESNPSWHQPHINNTLNYTVLSKILKDTLQDKTTSNY